MFIEDLVFGGTRNGITLGFGHSEFEVIDYRGLPQNHGRWKKKGNGRTDQNEGPVCPSPFLLR
jgi:hypothetical protein